MGLGDYYSVEDDLEEHEFYNMDDGRDDCDQSFYEQMNIDICGRESDCDAEDKEFWDKELGRNW